jgi:hypothetical protein
MKYLRTFEDYEEDGNYYWLIPTDKRYMKSLRDIGCYDDTFLNYDFTTTAAYIYVSFSSGWQFMPYGTRSIEYYKSKGREYGGAKNLTKDELEFLEILKVGDKYNI